MFHVYSNGALVETVDELAYVRRQRSGVVVHCPERLAEGILAGDAFYHLPWLPAFPDAADASIEAFSGAEAIAQLDETVIDLTYENILLEMGVNGDAV